MKLNSVLLVGLVSIGLLTFGTDSAWRLLLGGNSGGLQATSSYRLAPTPANQAWERNNAWTKYTAQNRQFQVPNVSTETSGSALQHNAVIRRRVANGCPKGIEPIAVAAHMGKTPRYADLLIPK